MPSILPPALPPPAILSPADPAILSPAFLPPDGVIDYIEKKYGKRYTKGWLAKLRCIGGGPKFHKNGWSVLYTPPDVDEWYLTRLSPKVSSTSELSQIKREAA